MTKTTNYQLNQWEASDYVRRTDFNEDNAKIDAALKLKGNCVIETGSYVGTGTYGESSPCTIACGCKPMLLFLNTDANLSDGKHILWARPRAKAANLTSTLTYNLISWQDSAISWYVDGNNGSAANQYNTEGTTYYYVVIGAAE